MGTYVGMRMRQVSEDTSDTSSIGAPTPISDDGVRERRTGIDLGHLISVEEMAPAPAPIISVSLAIPDGNHDNEDGNHGNLGNQGCARRPRRKSILPEWKLVSEG